MLPKAPKSLRRIHGRNRVLRENDFSTRLADPHAEFIIIRQHISDGFETSHFLHPFFPRGDGDVRVGRNYLREIIAPLREKRIGAVTSFYRAVAQDNFGAKLEAVGAASDFFL